MVEFHSHLEKVMQAEELRFKATPGFGQYKPFLEQALPHPAKANTKLLKFLIEHFTKEGDTILDPMCGSGSTGIVAAVHARNAVQIDIEEKFIKWAEEAKAKVERQAVFSKKGKITNVCGDARRLSELLKEVDVVLTSPPYAETISSQAGGKCTLERVGISTKTARNYDAIVTSPPYGEAQDGHGIAKEGYRGKKHSPTDLVGDRSYMPDKFESAENISKLKYDAVITSPPYAIDPKNVCHTKEGKTLQDYDEKRGFKPTAHPRIGYSPNEKNIGNLPFQPDTIITSPPYSEGLGHGGKRKTKVLTRNKGIWLQGRGSYSQSKENIGEIHHHETYLEAMFKCYREMWKVLKPEGLCIIVIKPFIRNKKVVDLPWHTWLLLEKVGFKLAKLYKLRLKNPSFWRILYTKKYPGVPEIKHEYVLVCPK